MWIFWSLLSILLVVALPILTSLLMWGELNTIHLLVAGGLLVWFFPLLLFKRPQWFGFGALVKIKAQEESALVDMRDHMDAFMAATGLTSETDCEFDAEAQVVRFNPGGAERVFPAVLIGVTRSQAGQTQWVWGWADTEQSDAARQASECFLPLKETPWGKEMLWADTQTLSSDEDHGFTLFAAMAAKLIGAKTVWVCLMMADGVAWVAITGEETLSTPSVSLN